MVPKGTTISLAFCPGLLRRVGCFPIDSEPLVNRCLLGTCNGGLAEVQHTPVFQRQARGGLLCLVAPVGSENMNFNQRTPLS